MNDLPATTEDAIVNDLIHAGHTHLAGGNRQQAHDALRQAAARHPQNEEIWVMLLDVVDSLEDRRGCLHNIALINPKNQKAARQARALQSSNGAPPAQSIFAPRHHPRPWISFFSVLALLKGIVLLLAFTMLALVGALIGAALRLF